MSVDGRALRGGLGVRVRDARVQFQGTDALANASVQIQSGEFLSIVGDSGGGKDVAFRSFACAEKPEGRRGAAQLPGSHGAAMHGNFQPHIHHPGPPAGIEMTETFQGEMVGRTCAGERACCPAGTRIKQSAVAKQVRSEESLHGRARTRHRPFCGSIRPGHQVSRESERMISSSRRAAS